MVANHHISRMNTLELKNLIYRRIGHQRAEKYFELLNQFLRLKLSKSDFDKSCVKVTGKENISLHNRLIHAIIHNASLAKVPHPKAQKVEGLGIKVCQRNSVQSHYRNAKCRSPVNRDRKLQDRPSPLGPLGKSPSLTCEETISRVQEESPAEMQSPCSKLLTNEDGEEVEQVTVGPSWRDVTAPFGVSVDTGRGLCQGFSYHTVAENCRSSQGLPDTESLRRRMLNRLASEGVGISVEGANVLNNGLNMLLKRLLESCIRMDPHVLGTQRHPDCQMMYGFNGTLFPGQNQPLPIQPSFLDFRVGMELNPSILGENWPTQLEKISHYRVE